MEIKLSSGDAMIQFQFNMVKNFITNAKMTEILPFKCCYLGLTKFIAKLWMNTHTE
jgi:hypothetical protein